MIVVLLLEKLSKEGDHEKQLKLLEIGQKERLQSKF